MSADRTEPNIPSIDEVDVARAQVSAAISLKRIADALEKINAEDFRLALYNGIVEGIYTAKPR